jgi:hypothetical protein
VSFVFKLLSVVERLQMPTNHKTQKNLVIGGTGMLGKPVSEPLPHWATPWKTL